MNFSNLSHGKTLKFNDENEGKEWKGPFYFVQGADTQLGLIARELEHAQKITWEQEIELSEKLVENINKMFPKPKFFVLCGDLCDAMPDTELEMRKRQEKDFKKVFEKLDKDIPLVCVCGNHDIGNTPTSQTIQLYKSSFGDDYFSFWCGGLLFLVLNSQYFFDSSKVPELAEQHEHWINEKLKEAAGKRVIIFQHIPWFLKSFDEDESYFNIKSELRMKWLEHFKQSNVEAIFCGHFHRNAGGLYKGMQIVVTSAVGGQLGNDKSGARIVKIFEEKVEHKYYEIGKADDEVVVELEDLKRIIGDKTGEPKEISISKSRTSFFVDNNGQKSGYDKIKSEVNRNGKLVAKLKQKMEMIKGKNLQPKSVTQTEVEIPSKGIHEFTVSGGDSENVGKPKILEDKTNLGMDKSKFLSGMEYSPVDLAEYIYWTGDEKNVALMIEDFLEKGILSRLEAINYLQSIKVNLDFMQMRDKNQQKLDKKNSFMAKQTSYNIPLSSVKHDKTDEDSNKYKNSMEIKSPTSPSFKATSEVMDVDEGLDLRSPSKEYSIEEVIYQLAKVMFSESLNKGSLEAQSVLNKLVTYLEKEVKNGQVSKNLERKLLDVLFAALTDTLSEQTKSMVAKKEDLLNIIDDYSPSSDTPEQIPTPDVESSLGGSSSSQKKRENKIQYNYSKRRQHSER